MNYLIDGLYLVTSGLLIPCVAYLLYLLLQSLMTVGGYFARKHREAEGLNELTQWVHSLDFSEPMSFPSTLNRWRTSEVIKKILHCTSRSRANHILTEYEVTLDKYVSRFSTQAKLGPIIGLMGTLIPMGPALQGLATGDIAQLATQMQVAFTTTVVGLVIGGLGFSMYQIERRRATQELALLDLLNSILEERSDETR